MFNQKTIEKRVMAVIRTRLATAQSQYDNTCKKIDAEALYKKEVEADTLVNKILGPDFTLQEDCKLNSPLND